MKMAAQLVPSPPSNHREGEAFPGGGRETRSKLALHGGFPPGPVAQSFHPSRANSFGQQTRPLRRRLSRTTRHESPGRAAREPQINKQGARPQPQAGEGTRQASGKTQAPWSSPSFAGPLSQGVHGTCPVRGCCSTGSTAGPVSPA